MIGGGAWGTALAQVCARAGLETTLWAREADVVASINASHENTSFLPGVELDPGIVSTADLVDMAGCDVVLAVTPAQHLRAAMTAFAPHARDGLPILLCAKGIEQGSLKLMTQVLAETIPQAAPAVLSGPSFAGEVARGLPTAVTLACPDPGCAEDAGRADRHADLPALLRHRHDRRRGRRRGEERAGHRLRHRRGPRPGPQRARRPAPRPAASARRSRG